MSDVLKEITDFADKVKDAQEKYKPAIEVGLQAVDQVRDLLKGLQSGNAEEVKVQLTKWADVNKTLVAVGKMDQAIKDVENGVEIEDVLNGILTAIKFATTIAAFV